MSFLPQPGREFRGTASSAADDGPCPPVVIDTRDVSSSIVLVGGLFAKRPLLRGHGGRSGNASSPERRFFFRSRT